MHVRVRFAPRPTEQPRISSMRIALFNWLFARHHGGTFILHIQDADPPMQPSGAADTICQALHWLGLDWEEGPQKGGPHGPYIQSQRLSLYQQAAHRLTQEEKAYAQGNPPAIRLKIDRQEQPSFSDLVLREQAFDNATRQDPLLLHPDGSPTFLLSSVVDDHLMQVSHVIRSKKWLPGTPHYLLLCQALSWQPPQFAHLPPIITLDGVPFDQCGQDASLDAYRKKGYLAPALVNHLALLGWSPRGKRRVRSLAELATRFDLSRVMHSPPVFERERLDWFNRRHLSHLGEQELSALFAPYLTQAYSSPHRAAGTALSPAEWQHTLARAVRDEVHFLGQVVEKARFAFVDEFFQETEAAQILAQPYTPQILQTFIQGITNLPSYTYEAIDNLVSDLRWQFKKTLGIRSRDAMFVIRAALIGQLHGPCLVLICQLLGRQRCIERVQIQLVAQTHG